MNHSEIVSFLWGVADLIRDTFKRGKYQDVILPLTVLRRLDCVLAETKETVLGKQAELQGKKLENLVVVATDVGAAKRARNVAQNLDAPLAIIEKRRTTNDDQSRVLNVIGDVEGRRALIVDDEIDTGTTIVNSAQALRENGVTEVYAACTHPVFSGDAPERLSETFDEVVVTDTIPILEEKRFPQLQVLSIAELIGEALLGSPHEFNWLFVMMKVEAFRELGAYGADAEAFLARVRACPPQEGFERVNLPGELERERAAQRRQDGIVIDETIWDGIAEAAGKVGIDPIPSLDDKDSSHGA